jgi:exopolysaccharide production protein ExoZ
MPPKSLLTNLQICRGLAAVMVVIGHSFRDFEFIAAKTGLEVTERVVNWSCGVDIFFVISGFIMVHVAGSDFGTPHGPQRFMLKRFLRIAPLYWLVTTVLLGGAMIAPSLLNVPIGGLQHVLTSYFFVPDWRPDMSSIQPVMALGWTLNYEMLFYVVFASCMLLPFKLGIAALTGFFVCGVAARAGFEIEQTQFSFWFNPIVLEFVFGVFIGVAYRTGFRFSQSIAVAIGLAGFVLVAWMWPGFDDSKNSTNFLRFGLPAAAFISAAALGPQLAGTSLARFGVLIGNASYALYLIHPFIIRPMRVVWLKLGLEALPPVAYVLICTMGASVAGLLLHRFVELPMGRYLNSLTRHLVQTAPRLAR